MSEDSSLKVSGSRTIFGLRSPQGPGVAVVSTYSCGGVGGFGSKGCQGSVYRVGMTGGLGG